MNFHTTEAGMEKRVDALSSETAANPLGLEAKVVSSSMQVPFFVVVPPG